jgi:hypothetical protein
VTVIVRRVLALLLLGGLVGLVSLAYASPPDPLWQSGIYDDADLDDVVIGVVTLTAIPVPPLALLDCPRVAVESIRLAKPRPGRRVLLDSFESRAPPLR